jgi:hypothetical protein
MFGNLKLWTDADGIVRIEEIDPRKSTEVIISGENIQTIIRKKQASAQR